MPDFLDLPRHVVEYILSCLGKDRRTLLQCRLLCRQINAMIFSPELDFLWEHIEFSLNTDAKPRVAKKKALGYLKFLNNVADYVKRLKLLSPRKQVPVTALQSLPTLSALTTLDLSQNAWLSTQHLSEFALKSNVENINLSRCYGLDDTAFAVMTNNWTNMESINISECQGLNDKNGRMSEFHDSLSSVKKYNFEDIYYDIYDSTVLRLVNLDGVADKLIELRLNAYDLTNAFPAIGSCLKLQLFSCRMYRSSDAYLESLKNLAALTHLHLYLYWSPNFSANVLLEFFMEAPFQLQHLSLTRLPRLNDATVEHIVRRYPGLKTLSIFGCDDVTDTGLAYVKELTELRLFQCSYLKNVDGGFLDFDPRRLPNLRFMNLQNSGVSEDIGNAIRNRFAHALVAVAGDWSDCDRGACASLVRSSDALEGGCCMHI